ncbi:MAG TPA: CYTH domain-containing protein [Solirubrobacteraceae bacterium]|jgi:adenylate cyclase|nr:CYTH domain-containing protein [Solirubrobacteraceae bacterium]
MPEIERKFLVRELPPGLGEHRAEPIAQGYLATAPDGVEVRIRRRGDATLLTVKSGPAMVRVEEEIAIEADRFDALWPLTAGRRLDKVRHYVPLEDGLVVELDVYGGALDGLMTAEIEFPAEAAALAFSPPPWLGEEVTGDPAYANQNLAVRRPAPGRPPG